MKKIVTLNQLCLEAYKDAYMSTCHFFEKSIRGCYDNVPRPVASGVFVEIDNNYFLFTAAHVVDGSVDDIVMATGTEEGAILTHNPCPVIR
jgi:hypothetical protein